MAGRLPPPITAAGAGNRVRPRGSPRVSVPNGPVAGTPAAGWVGDQLVGGIREGVEAMPITITDVIARDIRFPTSRSLDGSDAMNPDPDYSAAYCVLRTDSPAGLEGHGLTFTIGRGNELCCAAAEAIGSQLLGRTLGSLTEDMGAFW